MKYGNSNIFDFLRIKYGLVGQSRRMREVIELLTQAAPTDLAILITGETGTGKEVFANAIHGMSNRSKFPFVSVNCGAIPETLLESELFGHEKGAFTGAVDQRKGFFEVADKGTIFLDEIGEMPVGTQVKLLRVLESGEFSRLGSSAVTRVDVRVVAATNRELEKEVQANKFRQDLYFRLNSVHLKLPPLREHLEDINILTQYFGEKTCSKLGMEFKGASDDALSILKSLYWPGNVREFKNLIETILTLEEADYLTAELLQKHIAPALPAHLDYEQEREVSMIPYRDYDEPKKFELEIIFRTLLELKSDMNEIKHSISQLGDRMEVLYANMLDNQPEVEFIEQVQELSEEDLNLEDMERKMIAAALQKFDGNRRQAATALGISERTLYRKIQDYDIDD